MIRRILALSLLATLALLGLGPVTPAPADVDPTCYAGSSPTTITGSTLDTSTPIKSGVAYSSSGGGSLQLTKAGANFTRTSLGVASNFMVGCNGDFDEDGWTDFVASGNDTDSAVYWYKNQTGDNLAPDWTDPTKVRTPKFVQQSKLQNAGALGTAMGLFCGDANNDGHIDVAVFYSHSSWDGDGLIDHAQMYLGNGAGGFAAAYNFITPSNLQLFNWTGTTSFRLFDYNKDGYRDLVTSTCTLIASECKASLKVYLNNKAANPTFNTAGPVLATNLGLGAKAPGLDIGDFNGDNVADYVLAAPNSNKLLFFPGLLGGGVGAVKTYTFGGGGSGVLAGDFSLDGKLDVMVAADGKNGFLGNRLYLFRGNGTGNPFSAGADAPSSGTGNDFDTAWIFDYDHDPDHTLDVVACDGNDSGQYYLFANRVVTTYVDCGSVTSGLLDLGALSSEEVAVSELRIDPAVSLNGGSISWEASNDNGTTWHAGVPCSDDATKVCFSFDSAVGNQVLWRATMCSNATHTQTPNLTSVGSSYTYVTAENHFRAGAIASEGIIYVGAFRQPGNAGAFFALSDETGAVLWDAGAKLTTLTARTMYTMAADRTRLDFSTGNAGNTKLQSTLLVLTAAAATTAIAWQQDARFGMSTLRVLGAIENSTAALLGPPEAPYWYNLSVTPTAERAAIDTFVASQVARPRLLLFGSRDGALHAVHTDPTSAATASNGTEAWAFVPYDVAQRVEGDRAAGGATAYPDGSPTLTSAKIGGVWKTVLVMGEGNGGRSVFALDVTSTVTTAGAITGPTPLWTFSDANMGRTYSKPSVIRVKVSGAEKWLAVFASGSGLGPDVGDSVYAVDLATGALVWRFDLNDSDCYVATDITAAETDDESGAVKDGYVDRLFFADSKGRVWKLDPTQYSGTTINSMGTISVGLTPKALFSTQLTPNALGAERPISGTLAAAEDMTGRLTLFFGTGGTDDTPSTAQNEFYAVYADTGQIRSKLTPAVGVKYYGGVVYNAGQLIFTTAQDLSGAGLCSPTAGEVVAIDANTFAPSFTMPTSSKIVAPLFVANGELYTVTLKGEVVTSAYTGTTASSPSGGGGSTTDRPGIAEGAFELLGWRQVF